MKEIIKKDGRTYEGKIVTGDDIAMSSPFVDKTLTEVLLDQEEQISKLTRNVKYLTKYGGVGGGGGGTGGGGTGTIKTKFSSTITYTNLDGTTLTDNIRTGSFYAVQKDKEVRITVILTSTATLNTYSLSVTVGSNTINKTFLGSGKTATVVFVPESNSICTIQVSGETTATTSCSLYLNTNSFSGAVYDGDIIYSNDQEIYQSIITKPEAVYRITLNNYLPDIIVDDKILGLTVNGTRYSVNSNGKLTIGSGTYTVQTSTDLETNTKTSVLEITNCQDIFGNYGIYKITAHYHYNNDDMSQEVNYIYKSEDSFVYCYSDTGTPTLYQASQKQSGVVKDGTSSSHNYTENFMYRIYGRSGLDSSQTYSLYYTIFKEGDEKSKGSPWTYIDETSDQEITLPYDGSSVYFATYRESEGRSYGTGAVGAGSSSTFYRVTVTKNGSSYIKKVESYFKPTVPASVGTNYSISFSNSYSPSDFDYAQLTSGIFTPGVLYYTKSGNSYVMATESSPRTGVTYYYAKPKEITIKFYVTDPGDNHISYTTYYAYVTRTRDLEYVFTNSTGTLFYGAVHANTTDVINNVIDFPWQDGKYKLSTTTTKNLKTLCNSTINLPNNANLKAPSVYEEVSGSTEDFPFQSLVQSGKMDGLFSFGLKYYNDNYESPILKIAFNRATSITFYKTKIVYQNNTAQEKYDRFVFPSDPENYHLISFYFKNSYSFDGKPGKPALLVLIDGIIELAPITLDNSCSISKNTSITWYPGQWDYNYMGVMTFNGEPTNIDTNSVDTMPGISLIRRYYHDFDIIIPSNYYQTYREFCNVQSGTKVVYTDTFDSTIYDSLGDSTNWINYYNYSGLHHNKFVLLKNWQIANLTNLPIYIVQLEALESDTSINGFIENTLRSYKEEESDIVPKYTCSLQKLSKTGDTWTPTDIYDDVRFTIKYQGSSTLLYGAKNFYIESVSVTEDNYTYDYYWTPDRDKFKPEKGFNLKADMVDSSHSNNVIIGNFVNDYFEDEDNPGFGRKADGIRPCLTGEPIILVMTDSTASTSEPKYLYLGIYNLNLTRSSVINLGYQSLDINHANCTKITSNFPDEADLYKVGGSVISYPSSYVVAEVQGNNKTLYDYSQYDRGLLKYMFGDFYVYANGSASETYDPSIEKAFKGLNKLVYDDILKDNTFGTLEVDPSKFVEITGNFFYYPTGSNNPVALSTAQKKRCISETDTESFLTYSDYQINSDQRKISIVGNPLYQFHQVVDSYGNRIKYGNDYFYYLEELSPLSNWNFQEDDKFHYVNALKYYIVCMAFAMVDSVQKNLTIKCRNYSASGANTWYLGFYDMDTAFGVNNSGGQVDFKAFSDYITSDGEIVQDYCPIDITTEENNEGSLFDTPSSFLFLFAKYGNILHTDLSNPIIGAQYDSSTTNPLRYWINLRETGGAFETADKFCDDYVNNYFGDINPLLWNLNYMYKYFSETNNSSTSDTEISKFNGTMKYRRAYWLDNRFRILDVLFGIKNDSQIGNSGYKLNGSTSEVQVTINNPDVEITQTMFNQFQKGYPASSFSFEVTGEPRTPIVFQTSSSKYRLFIIDTTGTTGIQSATITSNVDCGFYGTQKITGLNEFGQFLLFDSDNTIVNSKIETINVLRGTATGSNGLLINLTDVKSVKNITIDVTNSNTKKFSDVTIQVPQTSNSSFILDNVIIKGITANNIRIANYNNTQSLTIRNLSVTNCTVSALYLENVIISGANTFGNTNKIGTYQMSGSLKNVSINDGICTQFSLNSTTPMTLSAALAAVETVTLGGSITRVDFTNGTSSSHTYTCESFQTSDLGCSSGFLMRGTGVSSLELNLDDSISLLEELVLHNNNAFRTLRISGAALNKIRYGSSAFGSTSLTTYQIKCNLTGNQAYKDLTETPIDIYYNGSSLFSWCGMKKEYMMPSTVSVQTRYHLLSASGLSAFRYQNRGGSAGNNNLSLSDVAELFKNLIIDINSANVNLSNMWRGIYFADGATLQKQDSTNSTGVLSGSVNYKLPSSYGTLLDGFKTFLNNLNARSCKVTNIDNWMVMTNMAIVTKEFFKLTNTYAIDIGRYSSGFGTYSEFFGSFRDTTSPGYSNPDRVYIEKGLLGKFTTIKIGNTDDTDGGGWRVPHVIFFDRFDSGSGDQSDNGSDIRIFTEPGFDEIFEDSASPNTSARTTTINMLGVYTDRSMTFDCKRGWPRTITSISDFCPRSSSCFMKNMNEMFYSVNRSCVVYIDRLFNRSTDSWSDGNNWRSRYSADHDGRLKLKDFFLNSANKLRFTPRLASKVNPEGSGLGKLPGSRASRTISSSLLGFTYPKVLNGEDEFRDLLKVLKYGDSGSPAMPDDLRQDWSYLFSNCYLICSGGSPNWETIIRDDDTSDLFASDTITYFDRCAGLEQCQTLAEGPFYIKNSSGKAEPIQVKRFRYQNAQEVWVNIFHYYAGQVNQASDIPSQYILSVGDVWQKKFPAVFCCCLDGTFRGFKIYRDNSLNSEIPLKPTKMFNDSSYNTIYSLACAFEGCHIEKFLDTFKISSNCISLYRTFYDCSYECNIARNKTWTGSVSGSYLNNYGCVGTNGSLPIIPNGFFDICSGATIDACFASSGFKTDGAEGQLYSANGQNPWWTGSSRVNSMNSLIVNARIHPILDTATSNATHYIFPTWYVNTICQCNVYIPVFTVPANSDAEKLVIFQSVPSGGSNYGGSLPKLPPNISGTYLRNALNAYEASGTRSFSIYLADSGSITLSPSENYRYLIPLSLADVLHLDNNVLFDNTTASRVDFNLGTNHPVVDISYGDLYQNCYYGSEHFTFRHWDTRYVIPTNVRNYITK